MTSLPRKSTTNCTVWMVIKTRLHPHIRQDAGQPSQPNLSRDLHLLHTYISKVPSI
jgi:hypothetical protein